jgi:hypothetical protein
MKPLNTQASQFRTFPHWKLFRISGFGSQLQNSPQDTQTAQKSPRITIFLCAFLCLFVAIPGFSHLAYSSGMKTSARSPEFLDRLLDSVSRCFTPETARALSNLRQDKHGRRRMEQLGGKASTGRLTPKEAREYQTLIETSDLIATLQLKARRRLASGAPA